MPFARTAFRVICLLGLGVSALLLAEYLSDAPSLCVGDGGCTAVRESSYASILGLPTPILGLVYFATALGLSLAATSRVARLRLALTGVGATAAVAFIVLQVAVIEAVCLYCMIADGSALALFALAWAARGDAGPANGDPGRAGDPGGRSFAVWGGAAAAVCALGLLVPRLLEPPGAVSVGDVPEVVAKHQDPERLTIVEFMDFSCPHCQALHKTFQEILPAYGDRVALVYKHKPRMQQHAARAALCAEEVGKGPEMTDRLFRTRGQSAQTAEDIARDLGLDLGHFRACLTAPRTDERIAQDLADYDSAGLRGIPTYWIGERKLAGDKPASVLRAHIDAELRRLDRAR